MTQVKSKEEIKQMNRPFEKLFDVVSNCNFDDFTLTLTWYVSDLNRFHELESNLNYGKVSFQKHNWKKQRVIIEVSSNFKKTAKADVNKAIDKEIERIIEENYY